MPDWGWPRVNLNFDPVVADSLRLGFCDKKVGEVRELLGDVSVSISCACLHVNVRGLDRL